MTTNGLSRLGIAFHTPVAPQSPDVAASEPSAKKKATRATKAPVAATVEKCWCPARGKQDQPGNRDAQARRGHDAGGDYDGLAETHHPGHAERGRLADKEARTDRHQREGRRQARLLHQKLACGRSVLRAAGFNSGGFFRSASSIRNSHNQSASARQRPCKSRCPARS
jgi:hypothetical protein